MTASQAQKSDSMAIAFKHNIRTLDENRAFCDLLTKLLKSHEVVIPNLAAGILESAEHLSLQSPNDDQSQLVNSRRDMDRFVSDLLRSRIGRRVLAE